MHALLLVAASVLSQPSQSSHVRDLEKQLGEMLRRTTPAAIAAASGIPDRDKKILARAARSKRIKDLDGLSPAPGNQGQLSRTPLNDLVTAAASGLEAHALWRAHTRLQLARRGKLAPVLQMGDLKPNDVGTLPRGLFVLGVIDDERAIISTDSGRLVWCVRIPTADLEDGQLLEDSRVFRVTGKYRYQRQLGDYVIVWELSPQ